MKAHIVGGGFGGLAAAAYLIRNAGVSGQRQRDVVHGGNAPRPSVNLRPAAGN